MQISTLYLLFIVKCGIFRRPIDIKKAIISKELTFSVCKQMETGEQENPVTDPKPAYPCPTHRANHYYSTTQ